MGNPLGHLADDWKRSKREAPSRRVHTLPKSPFLQMLSAKVAFHLSIAAKVPKTSPRSTLGLRELL